MLATGGVKQEVLLLVVLPISRGLLLMIVAAGSITALFKSIGQSNIEILKLKIKKYLVI